MSPIWRPQRLRSFGTAKTGPIPISSGSQPATAKPRKTSFGRMPSASATLVMSMERAKALGIRPKRSEEHTSELQSRLHLVCRLLLEKKKHNVQSPPSSEALAHVD